MISSDDPEEISSDTPESLIPEVPGKEKEKKEASKQFTEWLTSCEQEGSSEKKIRLAIDFMRASLSQGETPRFKDFWECRRYCLLLFKENISPKARAQLWGEYVELSSEARRLKNLLDEQCAFAIEQIELAILSIESDIEHFAVLLTHVPDIAFPQESVVLKEKKDLYNRLQKELQLLSTLATRINAFRKEIIKTEMRIRVKNKLLERLSNCGDHVFPRRKELIKNISKEFAGDADRFIQTYFQTGEAKELPLHVLREEIKSLQMLARVLTLNTQVFTATRHKLSACWDQLKSQEKERKKEVVLKRQTYRQNYELVLEKIQAFATECQQEISLKECSEKAFAISEFMKSVELGREEIRALRDELSKAKKLVADREQEKQQQRIAQEKNIELQRREKINALKEELNSFVHHVEQYDIDVIHKKREELSAAFEQMGLNKIEKQIVDRLFKQLKDVVAGKKEKAILALSEDDLKSLEQLKDLLKERMARRTEIKEQLEHYRKALGGSGFDFEKAMAYRELIEAEKASLEKIDTAIDELQQKIEEIEG